MRSLPAVLLDLYEELATGKLVLRRGRVAKSIDLVNGNPVSAASTPRDETLGHFLVGSGVINEEQHRLAVARAAELGGKLGEALIAQGVIGVEMLIEQLGKQARHKLVQALRWPQGAWRFDPGPAIEGIQLRMIEVVLSGLKETSVDALDRMTKLDAMSFELTERGARMRHELKRAFGETGVAAIADGLPIEEIERVFPDRTQARVAIDAMLMCDAAVARATELGLGVRGARPPTGASSADYTGGTIRGMPHLVMPRSRTRRGNIITGAADDSLFETLFADLGEQGEGAAPLDFGADDAEMSEPEAIPYDDSGVVSIAELTSAGDGRDAITAARQAITAEYQRIQGADHYAVLMASPRGTSDDIAVAYIARLSALTASGAERAERIDERKIAQIRAAYAAAHDTLLDDRKRAAYDRELAGGELVSVPPSIDSELTFRVAEELMARKQWANAIGHLKTVIARAPGEADYHAALGWAEWNAGGEQPSAADTARTYLNHALAINPDHPAAHDYKGRIDAALHIDDAEALFHLERALDLDPTRLFALVAVENLLLARGELRRYERTLKRVLFKLRGKGGPSEAAAWTRLGRLYLDHLDDPVAGAAAIGNARKHAPHSGEIAQLAARAQTNAETRRAQTADPLGRAGWREALGDTRQGVALVNNTVANGHGDAAFLAASTMVALGTADAQMAALYDQHRVRAIVIPSAPLTREQWTMLRHKDDTAELGALVELVAPAVHALAPMTLAESDIDPAQRVADGDLPPGFARMREVLGELLGAPAAAVYARVELGAQIHVIACDPPVLVAGDEALTAPERPELVFRLARALTFVWPGRAVGASRPGRVLRAVVLAALREATPSDIGADDALAARATTAVAALPAPVLAQVRAAALRVLSRGGGLNLSVWARSLSRTADRAGLLLCGDVPAAFAGAKEAGDLERDLIEFAYSGAHVRLRQALHGR